MSDEHFATCRWEPKDGYEASTPYGTVPMFCENGQRAVELMLLSAASCLSFFLVEYANARSLPVRRLEVNCSGELASGPTRVARICTDVRVDGDIDDKEVRKMVSMCERACKVMNTFKQPPETEVRVHLNHPQSQENG